jgi:excinuclease UvrABC helicase subunit UvrB
VVVASVSCIYGIGSVETYSQMTLSLAKGDRVNRTQLLARFVEIAVPPQRPQFFRGSFRVRGDNDRAVSGALRGPRLAPRCSATRSKGSTRSIR